MRKWLDNAGCDVEYILSLDESDYRLPEYYRATTTIINDNTCVVEATNHAARCSTGNILIYLSDDFDCFPYWGQAIIEEFKGTNNPMLLKVDDGLQPFGVAVLTIPIMNRALYEKLGYFWHPGYRSMFVDEDLYWTCQKLECMKMAPHIKLQHNHVSIGKADNDETYRRSAANWDQGKELFARRKKQYFPV